MYFRFTSITLAALLGLFTARCLAQQPMAPFVIPAKPDPESLVACSPAGPIAVDSPRVLAKDGHFGLRDSRIKLWAVNLTFAANFPAHADAEDLALRLSQAGVNCVRLHHMDTFTWEESKGIWDGADPKKLSPIALERLDYLLDQLAKHGIYADLNLHVSRTHSKFLGLPPVPGVSYDKLTDLFMPQLIEAQKDYARQLLGHVNPYRKLSYAQDPAIAIVEINNEDSLFSWGAREHLETLPEPYATTLRQKFCDWLKRRYGSTESIGAKWNEGATSLGEEMLVDPDFAALAKSWTLEVHEGNTATVKAIDDHAARVDLKQTDGTSWHVQFCQSGLELKQGHYYTMKCAVRADKARGMYLGIGQGHEPWESLGLDESVHVGTEWTPITAGFTAGADEGAARLSLQMADTGGWVEIKNLSLRAGGTEGLLAGETLEARNIAIFGGAQTERRKLDTPIFLAQTEKAFFDDMNGFIKNELTCNAMVTGTIVFGPLGLYAQSDMDFIDAHEYWQHPQFPGRAWDMNNWLVNQTAMVDHPEQATLFKLASSRLAGKPFTVTEYCHPAPNDFRAESVPEVATFAAAQDWDGVFLFDYGAVPNLDHFESFFDQGADPAKWAFMPSAARIFCAGGVSALGTSKTLFIAGGDDSLATLAKLQLKNNTNMLKSVTESGKIGWSEILNESLDVSLAPGGSGAVTGRFGSPTRVSWSANQGKGTLNVTSEGAFVWIGRDEQTTMPTVELAEPRFAAITLVPLDTQALATAKRILITACGKCENAGMQFSADRRTVGKHMGTGPVSIEAVGATLHLRNTLAVGPWKLQPVNASGRAMGTARQFQLTPDGIIPLDAKDATAWHLLTRN